MQPDRPACGFTLIESLVVVLILAALTRLMLPDLEQLLGHRRGELALRKVANSIFLARSAAARYRTVAVLCPSIDGRNCGGQWHDGVLLFLDRDDNQTPDAGDPILDFQRFEKLPGTLHWRAFRSKPYLQIIPQGFTRYQNGSFTWCDLDRNPASAHQLILNRTGRVRLARDKDGDGIRENSRGVPISCPG